MIKLSFFLLFSCYGVLLFAAGGQDPAGERSLQQAIGFDDLKAACQNPAKFHNQVAPSNIRVQCKDVQYKWLPDAEGTFAMGNGRQVTTAVMSDKYNVDAVTATVDVDGQNAPCPRFKQVAATMDTVKTVACEDLLAFTGTATDFCVTTTNALAAANPEAITITPTGQVIDLCSVPRTHR